MSEKLVKAFGSWDSPFTSEFITKQEIRFPSLFTCQNDLFWIEMRPLENGRSAIVRKKVNSSEFEDVLPLPYNARTTAHEYGGGATLCAENTLFFSNFSDQKVYKFSLASNSSPIALTKEGYKYADGFFDPNSRSIFYVREDHTQIDGVKVKEAITTIVSLSIDSGEEKVVAQGNDFYAAPQVNRTGKYLTYITWNHPNMPWDNVFLNLMELSSGKTICIAGDSINESILQPSFDDDDTLYFITDRDKGFWNIHRLVSPSLDTLFSSSGSVSNLIQIENVYPNSEAEFGGPSWHFGLTYYRLVTNFSSKEKYILTCFNEKEGGKLGIIDLKSRTCKVISSPYTAYSSLNVSSDNLTAYFLGGSFLKPSSVVALNLQSWAFSELKSTFILTIDQEYISVPKKIEFPIEEHSNEKCYGYYYPPTNREYTGPPNEAPPTIFQVHGGPTASAKSVFHSPFQYWTSRGFAIFDIDYSGSTGYGRAYRDRLKHNWGVADIRDCEAAAKYLIKNGLSHPKKLAIEGGSAGGFTVLACLTFKPDLFQAGVALYGVADLELLTKETHKFESHYLDELIAKYPQERDVYVARSPIYKAHQIKSPLAIYQGDEDKIVLPNQALMIYEALKKSKTPVALTMYQGEQHGFRKSQNIKKTLDTELYFFSKIFKFPLSQDISSIYPEFKIENLDN